MFGQETLTKTLLQQKQPSIKQGLPVNKKTFLTAVFTSALLSSALVATTLVNLGKAQYEDKWVQEGEVAPPKDAKPPTITIISPENNTAYASNNITLTLNISASELADLHLQRLTLSELYYRPSWVKLSDVKSQQKKSISLSNHYFPVQVSINLTDIPEGPHWLEVYAVAKGEITTHHALELFYYNFTYYVVFKMTGSSAVNFTIDTTAPEISILALEDRKYSPSAVPLNFTTNERILKSSYSLDGRDNVSIVGNTTLTDLTEGEHKITVFAWDQAGNTGASETMYFSVEAPLPVALVATASVATVAVVSVGLIVYRRKQRREALSK